MFEKEFESEPLKAKLGGMLLERELLEAKIAILNDGHPYTSLRGF